MIAVCSGVREFVNKSAASAASPDCVKFQAVIKSAASAASPRGGRASGRLNHGYFFAIFGRASGQKNTEKYQNLGLCVGSTNLRQGLMFALQLHVAVSAASSPDSV